MIHYFDELPMRMPEEFEGVLSGWIRAVVYDAEGNVVEKKPWKQSESFVKAFIHGLYGALMSYSQYTEDVAGASKQFDYPSSAWPNWLLDGLAGEDTHGLVVGTDNTAPTNNDYAMGTQIDHGDGAGELSYGITTFTEPVVIGSNVDLYIERVFQNNSGGLITIEEIGLIVEHESVSTTTYFLLAHDLLNVAVPDEGNTVIQYTLRTTV
jgi:hypothetical protein